MKEAKEKRMDQERMCRDSVMDEIQVKIFWRQVRSSRMAWDVFVRKIKAKWLSLCWVSRSGSRETIFLSKSPSTKRMRILKTKTSVPMDSSKEQILQNGIQDSLLRDIIWIWIWIRVKVIRHRHTRDDPTHHSFKNETQHQTSRSQQKSTLDLRRKLSKLLSFNFWVVISLIHWRRKWNRDHSLIPLTRINLMSSTHERKIHFDVKLDFQRHWGHRKANKVKKN